MEEEEEEEEGNKFGGKENEERVEGRKTMDRFSRTNFSCLSSPSSVYLFINIKRDETISSDRERERDETRRKRERGKGRSGNKIE